MVEIKGVVYAGFQQTDDSLGVHLTKIQSALGQSCDLLTEHSQSVRNLERQLGTVVLSSASNEVDTGSQAQWNHGQRLPKAESRSTLVSVHATLNTGGRCTKCYCQCHKNTAIGMPGLLSGVLGKLLLTWSAATFSWTRTCDHPKCEPTRPAEFD